MALYKSTYLLTKFTYLGSGVVSGSSSTPEVHRRICLVSSIVGQLDRVWRNRRLSLNMKLRLYTSLVQSVLLHGSEIWTLTKADTAQLQVFSHEGTTAHPEHKVV